MKGIHVKLLHWTFGLVACLTAVSSLDAQSIWARRNPYHANLFRDTRARRPGDVLTVQVRESTLFDGREDRRLEKKTQKSILFKLAGAFSALGKTPGTIFGADLASELDSEKLMNGKSDYTSERAFLDQMSVVVVAVAPNGNLLIEGRREQIVGYETRVLRITGIVRPIDIRIDNVVESQSIANLSISYLGKGPGSRHLNQGFFGRFVNKVWPF